MNIIVYAFLSRNPLWPIFIPKAFDPLPQAVGVGNAPASKVVEEQTNATNKREKNTQSYHSTRIEDQLVLQKRLKELDMERVWLERAIIDRIEVNFLSFINKY